MRKTTKLLLGFSLLCGALSAQNVNVAGALVGNGTYATLGDAFTAINGGAQTGANIAVSIVGNTSELATATLNQGTWLLLTISPSGGAGRTVSGSITGPLVDFNGADRVNVNGLNTGGNSLTFDNQLVGAANTIRFINDAHGVSITNTNILGAGTGTILFSTGILTGNDSINISNSVIDASFSGTASVGILSSGTVGMDNSFVTISNNRIANTFSATLATAAIQVQSNSTDWTIGANLIYQTATRNYTTANVHRGILVQSGNNHVINANIIGYSSPAQTGTYTMTSTVATRFVGIELTVGTVTASAVNNNSIAAFSLTTSSGAATTFGVFCGIYVSGGSVNIGTTGMNIIGSLSGTNSIVVTSTTSQALIVGISSTSTGAIAIQNNSVGGFTTSGVTAAVAGAVMGINCAGVASSMTITGNIIGNTTADNMRAGTLGLTTGSSIVSGITLPSTPAGTINVTNNIIRNLSSYGTGTSGYCRGIWTAAATGSTSTYNISGNNISNLITNSGLTTVTSGQAGLLGINCSIGNNDVVQNNIITNLAQVGTAVTASFSAGITLANATNTTCSGNMISNVTSGHTSVTITAPSVAAGIIIRSGTTSVLVRNNMITIGSGTNDQASYIGIYANHGSTPDPIDNIIHNTVNIGGTSTNLQPSFGFLRGDFTATVRAQTVNIVNNIFTNQRSGGTGVHVAIGNNYGNATSSITGWATNASNNNVLNATSAAAICWWTSAQTFAGWQSASASDASSYSGITVTYVNAASNLHLNMGVTPTPMESGGQTTTTVTDIDNDNRPGPTGSVNGGAFAPDIGADEFDGVYLDLQKPVITYTPLNFTCDTLVRTVTANISDFSGVPTTGTNRPRIYYRKNANAYVSTPGTLTAGTAFNGTWTFTISSSAMGGLVTSDVVSYFIIAQDQASTPNITSNPAAGLVATNVNTVTTPPTTPNTYTISANMSGTYTVGATGVFPTITAAVTAYNNSCLTGPVIFSLIDATYPGETFPITINQHPYSSSVNTLTIKPATGVTTAVSGSSATSIFLLNGADYVTIDGSNGTTANTLCPRATASRDMTITNTNTSTASAIVAYTTNASGNGATNNKLMNCIIVGNGSLTTGVAVNFSGPTIGSGVGANGNNDNWVVNNSIQQAQVGVFSAGSSTTTKSRRNKYYLNDLNSTGTQSIGRFGFMLLFEDSCEVISNRVGNIINTGSVDVCAISLGSNALSNSVQAAAETSNGIVSENMIENMTQSGTFSAGGIFVAASSVGTTRVSNNMINRIFCNGTGGDFAVGIYYGGGAGTMNIYHNTVNVTGTALTGASQPNMAIGINGTTPTVNILNNILLCSGSNGFNGNTGIGLAYTSLTGNYTNLTSDYNDIMVAGTGSCVGRTGGLAAGTTRITMADWMTETGRDFNSVGVVPTFVSSTDLHLVVGSNAGIEDGGTALIAVTSDYDCQTRDICTPDIGADEFGTPREINVVGNSVTINDGSTSPSFADSTSFGTQSVCSGVISRTFTIQNTGTTALAISSVNITGTNAADFTVTTAPATSVAPNGSTTFVITFDPSFNGTHTATVNITSNDCSESLYDFAIQGDGTEITGSISSQTNVSCNGGNNGSATVSVSGGMPSITYNWSSGGTNATESNLSANTYNCVVTDVNGCRDTITVTITEPPVITLSLSQTNVSCNGGTDGSATVTAGGGTGTLTYQWNPGGTNATESNIGAGVYYITVTDSNGCSMMDSVTITQPAALAATTSQTNVNCFGGGSGSATINVSGGTGSYTYLWSNSGTGSSIVNLNAGTYSVTVTDSLGCTYVDSVTITQNAALVSASSFTDATCNGSNDGTADVTVTGGTGVYTYSWSNGDTTSSISGLSPGTYICTITDSAGCVVMDTVVVNEPGALSITVNNVVNSTNCITGNGSIDISVSGGTPTYSFLWSNSNITEDITGLNGGQYIVNVTDSNGCTVADTILIGDPVPPTVALSLVNDTICQPTMAPFSLTGGSPAGGTYGGNAAISGGIFTPSAATIGVNYVTYSYTDPNTGCSGSATDSTIVDLCIGINEYDLTGDAQVYPNPFSSQFTLELSHSAVVTIYNSVGQQISIERMMAGRHDMNLEKEARGIYFVNIMHENNIRQVIKVTKD